MEENKKLKYILVIKREKNNYLPLEWDKFPIYKGQKMNMVVLL